MALFAAIANKDTFAAKIIINKYPALVHDIDEKGYSPLIRACSKHLVEVVEDIIRSGANVDTYVRRKGSTYGSTPLIIASHKGYLDIVQRLIDAKADLNIKATGGFTAVMTASLKGHDDIIRSLTSAGADVNIQNEDGWTALMCAVSRGHEEAAILCIDAGSNVNLQIQSGVYDGWTALMLAAKYNHEDLVRSLIDAGARLRMKTALGETALDLASTPEIVDIIMAGQSLSISEDVLRVRTESVKQQLATGQAPVPVRYKKQIRSITNSVRKCCDCDPCLCTV